MGLVFSITKFVIKKLLRQMNWVRKKTYLCKPGFNSQIFLVQRPKKASFQFLSDFSDNELWKYMNNTRLCILFFSNPRIQLHQNNWLWCNFVVSFVYNVAFSVHFWSKLVFPRPDSDNSIVMEFQPNVFPNIVSAETILFWIWKSKGDST